MPRSARHRRMLDAMGIRVFEPPVDESIGDDGVAPEGAPSAHDVSSVARGSVGGGATPTPPAAGVRSARIIAMPAADEVGVAIQSMDWATLESTVAACRACTLCESRTQTVFGVGHRQAHWMIVGEAPGETEDQRGEPFVGVSGHLLDAMLRALGLARDVGPPENRVYIANTIKCRPPKNRNPTTEELRTCEPYLRRQIGLVKPRVILAMGRMAVQSLLRTDDAIGRLRGTVHTLEGTPLVVTYHPAYLLRNPIDKARAWDDLCLAAEVAAQGR